MKKLISVGASLVLATGISVAAVGTAEAAPKYVTVCNSSNSNSASRIFPNTQSNVTPGQCFSVYNGDKKAIVQVITIYEKSYKIKVDGGKYGTCHTFSNWYYNSNPPNVKRVYYRTFAGKNC